MTKKESTTEALARMLKEQGERNATTAREHVVSDDRTVIIHAPGNQGTVVGTHKGDFTF